jgi:hypothetical protein
MLVARRDPPFQDTPHDGVPPAQGVPPAHRAYPHAQPPRLLRIVTMMQLFGSLLAVPIGLASAYSIYRANFSPETTCQTLRAGIVSMLDKSVDAGTRRMLVRGDVLKFEQDCAAVDPDAVAAFKTLLTVEKKPAPVAPVAQRKEEPRPQQVVKEAPVAKAPVAKAPAVKAPAVVEPVRREAAESDTQWLEAVRQAMAAHKEKHEADVADRPLALGTPPHPLQITATHPETAVAVPAPAPAVVPAAPAPVIAPPPDANHPVPPGAIPDPSELAAKPDKQPSRISRWIARVPLIGPVWENGQQ